MPEVKVTHPGLSSDDAKKPPPRTVVPKGDYHAIIMGAPTGTTQTDPPLLKIMVEFQILFGVAEETGEKDMALAGRRVWQDYILEYNDRFADMCVRARHELRALLDATDVPFTDEGFNTDHLLQKTVKITVGHRHAQAREPNEDGSYGTVTFAKVVKVDTAEAVDTDALV